MKKFILWSLSILCVCACMSLAGCGDNMTDNVSDKTSEVYFLTSQSEAADAYQELAQKYENETGVKVRIETVNADSYDKKLRDALKQTDAPTLFEITGHNQYNQLDDYFLDIKDSKIYSMLYDKSLAIGKDESVFAIPYSVRGYGILYNNDIMKKYFALSNKKSTLSSMEEVKNFDQLKIIVEDMDNHRSELGIDAVFATPALAEGEDARYTMDLLNHPLSYEWENGGDDVRMTALKAGKIDFSYGDNYRGLFDLYTGHSATDVKQLGTKTAADSTKEFALGKVAMMQGDSRSWEQIKGVSGNVVKSEELRLLPLYTGIEGEEKRGLDIGVERYIALNKKASETAQKNSLDFLEWLFSSQTGKGYVSNQLNLHTPFNTFGEGDMPDVPLVSDVMNGLKNGMQSVMMAIDRVFPGDGYYRAVGTSLRNYAAGEEDWNSVKATVTDRWSAAKD